MEIVYWLFLLKYANGTGLPELNSTDNHLREGWRFDNGSLHLSLLPNTIALIDYNSGESIDSVQVMEDTFNGMVPFIVYGLHVVDLFEWSSGFKDSSIRFTWLVEPEACYSDGLDFACNCRNCWYCNYYSNETFDTY